MAEAIAVDRVVPSPPKKRRRRPKRKALNSDPEDDDFSGSSTDGGDESDSDIEEIIPNEEAMPEKSRRNTSNPQPKKKRKTKHKTGEDEDLVDDPAPEAGPSRSARKSKGKGKLTTAGNYSNKIYLFYERVTSGANGEVTQGSQYWKSCFGNHEIVEITAGANYNNRKLQKHLKEVSLPHYQLFNVLQARTFPPTDRERALACGATELTDDITEEYIEIGKRLDGNVKKMFEKQAAAAQVPWNQEHFETLLANNGYAFLAIVIHYIDNEGKLEECLIDFRELVGQHSGENMGAAVWQTVEKFGLIGQITAFVMDNATNNDTMIEAFTRRCKKEGILFSAADGRMRCMPHTIHLSALRLLEAIGALTKEEKKAAKSKSASSAYQDSTTESLSREADEAAGQTEDTEDAELVSPDSLIGTAVFKLRKIIRHVQSSPQRRKRWEQAVKTALPTNSVLMLILDFKTRWSSTHQMLRRALDFRKPILDYMSDYEDLTEHSLSPTEWAALTQVTGWLKSYRYATTKMSTTKHPMLSTTHAIFRWLQDELKTAIAQLPRTADPALLDGLVGAHRKLSDYFTKFDESRYYSWATLLDPRLSYTGLRADYADDPDLLEGLEKSKAALEAHFQAHYANLKQPSGLEEQAELSQPSPPGSPAKFNIFKRYGAPATSTAVSQNELEDYFRLTSIPEPFEQTDPLQWWYTQRHKLPNLYRLARDVLCIPGSAVAVERVFSGGRDTIGLRHASLKAETIEMLMFVKARLRLAREEAKTKAQSKQKAVEMVMLESF
ncbi:Transposase-like protein [Mycena sanguinolenta]|uniref:Transposase-like protein n=1 Tax=Mycena sanguinolenta TaxID=230812 RepID=A0A8H7DF80_9AGAR|nr:Transposase-like protein [Mycena sanguinolenta]